ncbi:MAG: lasso RiPP family leader peptide-containing protein [Myxococcales bacterium]|nr:lasso RiPP family leader peptide-containing protein [Myxococcales bacterium]
MKPAEDVDQKPEKLRYETPKLTELGKVTDLTHGSQKGGVAESRFGISEN